MKFSVPLPQSGQMPTEGGIIIGGDGYAYVPYSYNERAYPIQFNHLLLLRIDSSGAYETIRVFDWTSIVNFDGPMLSTVNMITNGDQGILLSWDSWGDWWNREPHMAITTGATASLINSPAAGQFHYVAPALQLQDGSFVGTASVEDTWDPRYMVAFDATGNLLWSVAGNYQPQIATADGGIIATIDDGSREAVMFDQNGNVTGQIANLPIYSWKGNAYRVGSIYRFVAALPDFALSFGAFLGGSLSPNGAAVKFVQSKMFLPAEISDTAAVNKRFYDQVKTNFEPPTKVAVELLVKGAATEAKFKDALATTDMIVAFGGHGVLVPGTHNAVGLCFGSLCLVFKPLTMITQPDGSTVELAPAGGTQWDLIDNGLAPKAKIVFLAACGIDENFIAQ